MNESACSHPALRRGIVALVVVALLGGLLWWYLEYRQGWPRGEALGAALESLIKKKDTDQSLVASAILENYTETRTNASRWSGIYWGFTFVAAALSALAALILKFEYFIKNEAAKKDVAAALSVIAALLITISTSGDFQRKWQANRIAAAELEHIGYELLSKDAAEARSYLSLVGQILLQRHLAIVGTAERRKAPDTIHQKPVPEK